MRLLSLLFVVVLTLPILAQDEKGPPTEKDNLPLLLHLDLASPDALKRLAFTDPSAWKLTDDTVDGSKRPVLALFKQSDPKPLVRSPVNQAWIAGLKVTHFVMEVKCRTTREKIPNRDLCFLFGGVDPTHFLYAHLAQRTDKIHNQVHLVDGKDRAPVTVKTSDGTPWGDGYHTVRIARDDWGTAVHFDGRLLMTTDHKGLPAGKLGFGSFDDTANFATVTVWGKKAD
jgi:hypothetical protein